MLAIQASSDRPTQCTPNLAPFRPDHDGPINAPDRFWKPAADNGGELTAYFRGRKLKGRPIKVPGNYQGAVLEVTGRVLQPGSDETGNRSGGHDTYGEEEEEDGDADEQEAEVKIAEQAGLFDEFVVWGHDAAPQEMEDPYLKGINEWIGFAEAMHGDLEEQEGVVSDKSS